jgi:hypothetical protein
MQCRDITGKENNDKKLILDLAAKSFLPPSDLIKNKQHLI